MGSALSSSAEGRSIICYSTNHQWIVSLVKPFKAWFAIKCFLYHFWKIGRIYIWSDARNQHKGRIHKKSCKSKEPNPSETIFNYNFPISHVLQYIGSNSKTPAIKFLKYRSKVCLMCRSLRVFSKSSYLLIGSCPCHRLLSLSRVSRGKYSVDWGQKYHMSERITVCNLYPIVSPRCKCFLPFIEQNTLSQAAGPFQPVQPFKWHLSFIVQSDHWWKPLTNICN